jgi:hypothetical protein
VPSYAKNVADAVITYFLDMPSGIKTRKFGDPGAVVEEKGKGRIILVWTSRNRKYSESFFSKFFRSGIINYQGMVGWVPVLTFL